MRVIAIALQAGGVGKTTLAHNLSALLADLGRRVLAIDTDGQCNLTEVLSVDAGGGPTIYEVLVPAEGAPDNSDATPITKAIYPVEIRPNLQLVPSSPKMGRFDAAIADREHREFFLRDALSKLSGYDYVLIDCPPGLGLVLTNALMAAHEVLIPVLTRQRRVNALPNFLTVLKRAQRFNPSLQVTGIVPNQYAGATTGHDRAALNYIERFAVKHGIPVFPAIPPTVRFSEAEAKHLPLCDYDRTPPAATVLERIADIIDHRAVLEPQAVVSA
jgi:chromosome partitioning protein